MKTLRRLIISHRPISDRVRQVQEEVADMAYIPGVLQVVNDYVHIEGLLSQLTLESDRDLDEYSIEDAVASHLGSYHNVHLPLTTVDWKNLGIRLTLHGQSREIGDVGYTYNRPRTGRDKVAHKYSAPVSEMSEEALIAWHELDHTVRALLNVDPTSTHYHFYGYATKYEQVPKAVQNQLKPRRYVRKPDPLEAWRALPWHLLKDLEEEPEVEPPKQYPGLWAQLMAIKAILDRIAASLNTPPPLVKPLRAWGQNVSQPYGEYNPSLYPLTQHHIGVDHAVGVGTPVYAPADGEVVQAGYSDVLGYYAQYKYRNRYLVALHLKAQPVVRTYKAGEQIAEVGDTGFIQGVHSHIEIWTQYVDRTTLPANLRETWRNITRDPLKEF